MSGGVDSSVAAWLLKQQGYDVVGLFMKNWEDDDDDEYCSTRQDWIDAASAADVIGVDIEAVNFAAEYKDRVFAEFLREYSAGRTPNPDVLCNAEIKFKAFLDHAVSLGAAHIATGHYARVRAVTALNGSPDGSPNGTPNGTPKGTRFELLRGLDAGKDQSYFLHRLSQAQLSRALFPIGHLPKREVREIAARIGLPNAAKKDSTGICFIGERPFREFLNRYLPTRPGPMIDDQGRQVGEHVGLAFYTLGQRKGIGLGGAREGSGEPWFVARKDMASNTLTVVQGHQHPWLLSTGLQAEDAHWIAGVPPVDDGTLGAKTRYRQQDAACALLPPWADEQVTEPAAGRAGAVATAGATGVAAAGRFSLRFAQPQWAVTPGQSAVLYRGEVCLGGGVIVSSR
ncbi:MAG: tRNA 2-thiouridine(34) synthase MnmA [Burkholderiales bacterium]|nr:tRNA 2-thiouridine(34) synthase MnmA [Burkholderiales bacterium]